MLNLQIIFLVGKASNIILPETYYLDYFNFVLEYVEHHYEEILLENERDFLNNFRQLSFSAQCTYVRMANRKGSSFRPSKLVYREIQNVDLAIEELHRRKFAGEVAEEFLFDAISKYTKPELLKIIKNADWMDFYVPQAKKLDIIILILENLSHEEIVQNLSMYDPIVSMKCIDELEVFKLLFFGNHYGDMSQFVIRDIGNAKFEKFKKEDFTPHFKSRNEVDAYLFALNRYRDYKVLREEFHPLEIYDWFTNLEVDFLNNYQKSRRLLGKLANRLGYELEKEELLEEALVVYEMTSISPSFERRLRILKKLGLLDKTTSLAHDILESSHSQKDKIFAKDVLESIQKDQIRISRSTTKKLKSGTEISIDKPLGKVEQAAIEYFQEQGYEAHHTENFLWRNIFGLVFWEELFSAESKAIHNPLQRAPSDLYDPDFFKKRGKNIKNRLEEIESTPQLWQEVESIYQKKEGISNAFVYWHEDGNRLLKEAIDRLPLAGIKAVLLEIAKNTRENSTGFADLFVFKDDEYKFYEVKSPNDHLSDQQLFWLDFFEDVGIEADILKIKWND